MLEISSLHVYYGKVEALHGVDLIVREGEVVTMVGANGAGKSTLLNAISGTVRTEGSIVFDGEEIRGMSPEKVVRRGIVHVPEGRRIFPGLKVTENLEVAAYGAGRKSAGEIRADKEMVLSLFPGLQARKDAYGWSLSGGEQQMLAIGRGLMAKPRVLLLDEPSLGLAPILVEEVFRVVEQIRQEGTTILLAEQNALKALGIADRGYVLETGNVTREGPAKTLLSDQAILDAYLGGGEECGIEL
jgi:branched-chain amino acid transport system ATP-binding protein